MKLKTTETRKSNKLFVSIVLQNFLLLIPSFFPKRECKVLHFIKEQELSIPKCAMSSSYCRVIKDELFRFFLLKKHIYDEQIPAFIKKGRELFYVP